LFWDVYLLIGWAFELWMYLVLHFLKAQKMNPSNELEVSRSYIAQAKRNVDKIKVWNLKWSLETDKLLIRLDLLDKKIQALKIDPI
jgi:hypothetical protein